MLRAFLSAAALVAALLPAAPAAAGKIQDYQFSGEWTGGAYSDSATNRFSSCSAFAEYKCGITFQVTIGAGTVWNIGLAAYDWGLPLGRLNFSYRLDDGVWRDGTAFINDPEIVILPMPTSERVIDLFRRSRQMQIKILGQSYFFNLDGTAKLTAELVECVDRFGKGAGSRGTVAAAAPAPSSRDDQKQPAASSGTGIVVSDKGYVLTNNHVVQSCTSVSVTSSGAAARSAAVIRRDETNDFALLQVDGLFPVTDVATFRVGSPLQAGETVAVYGYPLAGMLSQSGNIVAGNITALSGLGDDVRFVQISAPVQPGNSGGPLIDAGGLLVGVVNARLDDVAVLDATGSLPQNVNFAIRANVAMNFLDAHSIPYRTSAGVADLSLVAIAAQAKRFAVFVNCE